MKKQCQYKLLPTDKASNLGIRIKFDTPLTKVGQLGLLDIDICESTDKDWEYQHLYILSDDEIKEGDWYYNTKINAIRQYLDKESTNYIHYCKKIIATTNPELNKNYIKEALIQPLSPDDDASANAWMDSKLKNELKNAIPAISQPDIEYIISLYNGKGKEVDNLEDRKIVAAQQYALSKCGAGEMGSLTKVKLAWENGFENAQCLRDNDDKKFTLKDLIKVIDMATEGDGGMSFGDNKYSKSEIIQSITKEQPKSDTVMVEYENELKNDVLDERTNYKEWTEQKPKLKDGCIVVIEN